MEISFTGKRALVTGASKGIGRGIAKKLAECGAHVVAVGRSQEDLESLKKEVTAGVIEYKVIDVSNWTESQTAIKSLGLVHLLVNCAGISSLQPFVEVDEKSLDSVMNINFKGLFGVSQVVARSMIENKIKGTIVNVSSIASVIGLQDHAAYCASKGAVDSLTQVMALELGRHGIRTNSVNPTVTMTDMGRMAWSDPAKANPLLNRIPLGRFAEVEEIVDAVLYLLSDKSSYLNGIIMPIEGGLTAN